MIQEGILKNRTWEQQCLVTIKLMDGEAEIIVNGGVRQSWRMEAASSPGVRPPLAQKLKSLREKGGLGLHCQRSISRRTAQDSIWNGQRDSTQNRQPKRKWRRWLMAILSSHGGGKKQGNSHKLSPKDQLPFSKELRDKVSGDFAGVGMRAPDKNEWMDIGTGQQMQYS